MEDVGSTHGQTTFRAATDLAKFRLVRAKAGSLTVPVEVEYTDNTIVMGVTDESARAGELVSIRPLNLEGTYEFEVVIDSAIEQGTPLFIADDGTGRATDKDTGNFVGQAINAATTDGQIIEAGGVVGGIGSGAAEDVSILDSGAYYTDSNVEGALAQLGRTVVGEVEVNQSVLYCLRTDSLFNPLNVANIGGVLASDTSDLQLLKDGNGVIFMRCNVANGSSAYLTTQAVAAPGYDPTTGFGLGLYYYRSGATPGDWLFSMSAIYLSADGSTSLVTNSGTLSTVTGALKRQIISPGISGPSDIIGITINIQVSKSVTATAGDLRIYSLFYTYDRIMAP